MTERRPPGRASRTTVTPEAVTIKRTKTMTTSRILALHQDRKKHLSWPNSVIRHGQPQVCPQHTQFAVKFLRRDLSPIDGLVPFTLVGWAAAFSTRRVDFLSIKLGIRVCSDICGLSNRSSSPHDSLLASLSPGLIITAHQLRALGRLPPKEF